MAKVKKAQRGKNVPKGMVESEMHPGKMYPKKQMDAWQKGVTESMNDQYFSRPENIGKRKPKPKAPIKKGKMKDGGKSFPDLNKDGKITKADILKGRGVIAKKGAKVVKKAMAGCKACWGSKMKKSGK